MNSVACFYSTMTLVITETWLMPAKCCYSIGRGLFVGSQNGVACTVVDVDARAGYYAEHEMFRNIANEYTAIVDKRNRLSGANKWHMICRPNDKGPPTIIAVQGNPVECYYTADWSLREGSLIHFELCYYESWFIRGYIDCSKYSGVTPHVTNSFDCSVLDAVDDANK